MAEQLELPGLRHHRHDAVAAQAIKRLGCEQWWCTACGYDGDEPHTPEQCVAMRPRCHVEGCDKPTCIQAMHNGHAPTCLDHFFGRPLEQTPKQDP